LPTRRWGNRAQKGTRSYLTDEHAPVASYDRGVLKSILSLLAGNPGLLDAGGDPVERRLIR